MEGTKSILMLILIVAVGALLGSFIGGFIGHAFPEGIIYDLFSKEISAGLEPTTLDLRILIFTFGCLFKFNVPSVLGIILAAFLVKTVTK